MEKFEETLYSETEIFDYRNTKLPINTRVLDLLSRMNLKEKIQQMMCVWNQKKEISYDEKGELDFSKMEVNFDEGIGQVGRISDTWGGLTPKEMALLTNKIQKYLLEKTRLGIPAIFHEECLHGLAAKDATSYPQPIGMAATFNPLLIEEIYTSVARDTRMRGAHQALTPVVDVNRDPRWGRVEETFGEDPFLIAEMSKAAVKGFQGNRDYGSKERILATLKHFAAHGQPESGSNCGPVNVSERILRDVFLAPFKEVISETQPETIMASYNEIDGIPSHANQWLLRKVLREEWGYKGFVVSDYYAITELNYKENTVSHSLAVDKKEAAYLGVKAGVNIEFPEVDCYPEIEKLIGEGRLTENEIDELIRPMLEAKFRLGLFEDPYVDIESIDAESKLKSDRGLALKAARETITLLKNDNETLPLNPNELHSIAVIGPNANRIMLGGYSGTPKYYSTVLDGIQNKLGENVKVKYAEGCKITIGGSWTENDVTLSNPEEDEKLIKEAVELAKDCDKVVMVLGGNEQTSREAWDIAHLGDRTNLELVGKQNQLFSEIKRLGKPIIVVLFNGRPLSINLLKNDADAILECWYLGQENGRAVADVLFGDVNPSGKLPISIPRSVGHIPCHYNHKPSSRRGYLFDDISPLYAFGYGLSYTEFSLSDIKISKAEIKKDETVEISVKLKNEGRYSGSEVVQLYIRDKYSSVTRPVKELKGFKKEYLAVGEDKEVKFEIGPKHLSFTDINMDNVVEPGDFEIMVGRSSDDKEFQKVTLRII